MQKLQDWAKEVPLYQWFLHNIRLNAASMLYGRPRSYPPVSPRKEFPCAPRRPLPLGDTMPEMSLAQALLERKSIRDYDPAKPITIEQLSGILHLSYGVTHRLGPVELRAAASAGARYPIEIYLYARDVAGLDRGLYHYDRDNHVLDEMRLGDISTDDWAPAGDNRAVLNRAQCVIIMSAVFERSVDKYGDRGLQYIFMDAGHLGQNLYLTATAYGVGCTALGGFYTEPIDAALQLDGFRESVIYLMAMGTPAYSGL